MKGLFEFFCKRHILATLLTLMILLLGLNSLRTLKRDMYPHVDFGQVEISTYYPGASPEDVELNVTNKIEEQLKNVAGIKSIVSTSLENVSSISITLEPGLKDTQKAKDDIHEAVGRVSGFPSEVTESPFIIDIDTSWIDIIEVGIVGDLPYPEMREIAKRFEKKLSAVPGVKMLTKYGYRAREIKVEVNPAAIDRYQIPLREIIQAVQARNIRMTGGTFESYTSEKNVVTLAQFRSPAEVGDVIVRSSFEGSLIKIKDLAVVKEDFTDESIISHIDGEKSISFVVYKNGDADIIRTTNAIKKLIRKENSRQIYMPPEEEPEGLPGFLNRIKRLIKPEKEESLKYWSKYGNVRFVYSNDQSVYVQDRFEIVGTNGAIGLVLVVLMLTIFLPRRTAFWVAMGIPVSVMGVFMLLPSFGAFLDILSLTSLILVIGIIVDDGIIISENINRHYEMGLSPLEASVEGTREVFLPVLTTIISTFLVFLPMFFMTGMIGKFVYVIPLVVSLALLISFLESVFALPAHIKRGYEKHEKKTDKTAFRKWFHNIRRFYKKFCYRYLKLRYLLVALFIVLLVGSLWYAGNNMDFILFPTKAADLLFADIQLPGGTSLQATEQKVIEIENMIKTLPERELATFISRSGQSSSGGRGENYAWIGVALTPYSEKRRTADKIVEDLRLQIEEIEGIDKIVFQVAGGGPPTGRLVDFRVIGSDNEMREELAGQVEEFLKTLDGVKDITKDDKPGKQQIEIKINYDRLARMGLTVADVARNVRIAFDGEVVTSLRDGDEDIDFRVQLAEVAREDIRYLENLSIPNRQGRLIKLREVARLETGPGPTAFKHFDGERVMGIVGDIDQDITSPLEVTGAVFEHFNMEEDWPGMQLVVGGEAEESENAVINLAATFVIAFVGIYFLLVLLFNSYIQPFLVMVAIPFGIIGVIIALSLHGEPLGFFALIGTIGLAGVVVNDSLVLVSHLNTLKKQKPDATIKEIVSEGTSNRLRAIMLTSITTVSGLLPLAYGIGGSDIWMAPMALTLGYGIVFATPLTLVLIPCLYVIGDDLRRIFKKKEKRPKEVVSDS